MTMPRSVRRQSMSQTDFMSWRMESDPVLRSTIVAVALLDREPDWARFVEMMERAVERFPIFRSRVVEGRWRATPPRWVEDPDFDLTWHLRRFTVPDGAGWEGVLDVARTAAMTSFDKDRPLWEFTVLGGLEYGRAALVMKVHHCLTDGVGGMRITQEIVDLTRDGRQHVATGFAGPEPLPGSAPPTELPTWFRNAAGTIGRTARHPVGALDGALTLAGSVMRYARPVVTTLSPVMTDRSTRRRFAVLDVPVEALGRAASRGGGSINDAFLAAVLLGTARYHRGHGASVPRLRVTLPISLRTDTDALGGNRITLARFSLPADVDAPADLIGRVHSVVGRWRNEPAVAISPVIAGALNLLPAQTLGNMLEHVDFVASDVVGSLVPLFMAGAEILRYYAFSPTLGAAFNVTLMSYTSRCCVGIDADAAAVPDLENLTEALADGFRDVLALCPDGSDRALVATGGVPG